MKMIKSMVTLIASLLIGNTLSAAVLLQDDFNGATVDTAKWTVSAPGGTFTQDSSNLKFTVGTVGGYGEYGTVQSTATFDLTNGTYVARIFQSGALPSNGNDVRLYLANSTAGIYLDIGGDNANHDRVVTAMEAGGSWDWPHASVVNTGFFGDKYIELTIDPTSVITRISDTSFAAAHLATPIYDAPHGFALTDLTGIAPKIGFASDTSGAVMTVGYFSLEQQVPEPAAFGLLAIGGLILWMRRGRR